MNRLDFRNHFLITRIGVIGDEVERPPAGLHLETLDRAAIAGRRNPRRRGVNRRIAGRVRVVPTEPNEPADGVREVGGRARNDREASLLRRNRAFPHILFAVDFPVKRAAAHRNPELTAVDSFAHIVLGSVVMVAHQGGDVGGRQLFVRLNRPRIRRGALDALRVIDREIQRRRGAAEDAPNAFFAGAQARNIDVAVSLAERERLARFRVVQPLFNRERLDVFRVNAIRRVVFREDADASLVGVRGDFAVRNAHRDPNATLIFGLFGRAGAADFENPSLVLVADGDRLADVGVPVFVDQTPHQLDGFPSGRRALERRGHQLRIHKLRAVLVLQFLEPAEGRFRDRDLFLIHNSLKLVDHRLAAEAEDAVSRRPFREDVGAADRSERAVRRFDDRQFREETGAVRRVRNDASVFRRRALGNDEVGASENARRAADDQRRRDAKERQTAEKEPFHFAQSFYFT